VSLGGAKVITESEVFYDGGLVQRVIVRKMGGAFGVFFQRIGWGCARRESVRKIVPGGRAEVEGGRGFGWGGGGLGSSKGCRAKNGVDTSQPTSAALCTSDTVRLILWDCIALRVSCARRGRGIGVRMIRVEVVKSRRVSLTSGDRDVASRRV